MDIFERNSIDIIKVVKRDIVGNCFYPISFSKMIISILKRLFFTKYHFDFKASGSKIIFMIGTSSVRFSEEQAYLKIRSCASQYDMIYMTQKIRLSNIPYNIYLICKYSRKFRKQQMHMAEQLNCLRGMLQIRSFLCFLERLNLNKYKAGVVYNDLDRFDNTFVQYLKNIGVTTMTCQHGIFNAPRSDGGFYFSGVELQHSIADIFLAWNQMTYDEAILSGMDPSKIEILGIPKCIGSKRNIQHKCKNVFGVVLNHIEFNDYNIQLLKIANYIADKNGMKYCVKFHPASDLSSYDDYLDVRYANKLPIKTSVAEYADLVDFSILSHSTVYVELLFLRSKVYLLHIDSLCKFTHFPEYDFSSKEELDELIHKEYDIDKMFTYYCFTENPKQEYTRFFQEIKN